LEQRQPVHFGAAEPIRAADWLGCSKMNWLLLLQKAREFLQHAFDEKKFANRTIKDKKLVFLKEGSAFSAGMPHIRT